MLGGNNLPRSEVALMSLPTPIYHRAFTSLSPNGRNTTACVTGAAPSLDGHPVMAY